MDKKGIFLICDIAFWGLLIGLVICVIFYVVYLIQYYFYMMDGMQQ